MVTQREDVLRHLDALAVERAMSALDWWAYWKGLTDEHPVFIPARKEVFLMSDRMSGTIQDAMEDTVRQRVRRHLREMQNDIAEVVANLGGQAHPILTTPEIYALQRFLVQLRQRARHCATAAGTDIRGQWGTWRCPLCNPPAAELLEEAAG